jgi:Histidine kinase-, DNA gyrase B-, and HSP90-like ATPase
MSSEKIARTAFRTSRLLDFVYEKELTLQCGYSPHDWPLVAVKELLDNALDACEERGIAPKITVKVDDSSITVADNGAGIPPDVVDRLLDFSVRVSSREAYVAPDRGAQGNALKTIVAMPFVLDGEEGRVDIAGCGVMSEISFCVDRIQQRPAADVSRSDKDGSLVRVHWTSIASSEDGNGRHVFTSREAAALDRAANQIRQICWDFTFLNPHLTLTVDLFGEVKTFKATNPEWRKWTPSSPTSPHWYEPEHLERLVGAYITHDLQNGNQNGHGRTVREFVSEFKGLTSTIKQKRVLAATGLSRAPLSALLVDDQRDFDHEKTIRLLGAMKTEAKPVGPRLLGALGRAHLAERFGELGIRKGSFEYKKVQALGEDGIPQVTEVAFAALEDEDSYRRLVTGVNWSAAWVNPFRTLGEYGRSLDTFLTERRFEAHRPIALLVHVAHPRVQYADRGKSTVVAR